MGGVSSSLHDADEPGSKPNSGVHVKLEDLELPPRRDVPASAKASDVMQFFGAQSATGGTGGTNSSGAGGAASARVSEEIFAGGEAQGQRAFRQDGLVGTEQQQLELLAHYAELCEDFRLYQRITRMEGAPREVDGSQLLLLSGPPGTGKTAHAVSFARALGLPLLLANPATGASSPAGSPTSATWAAQLRREVRGRDCVVFFDEIDRHSTDESFTSELRQFLDGVCQPIGSRVLLVGTTNRLDRLPDDVVHRAEVVSFKHPQQAHLEEMWGGYAQHLRDTELGELAAASAVARATGRDVRHCAALAERSTAIHYLNTQAGQGYCHGGALANCPPPPLDSYIRCIRKRAR